VLADAEPAMTIASAGKNEWVRMSSPQK